VRAPDQPAPGWTVVLRRQPVGIVAGQPEGGYTDAYELICCECGDHPDLDYCDISPELQQVRGPYTFADGIAAYGEHIRRQHRQQLVPEAAQTRRSKRSRRARAGLSASSAAMRCTSSGSRWPAPRRDLVEDRPDAEEQAELARGPNADARLGRSCRRGGQDLPPVDKGMVLMPFVLAASQARPASTAVPR